MQEMNNIMELDALSCQKMDKTRGDRLPATARLPGKEYVTQALRPGKKKRKKKKGAVSSLPVNSTAPHQTIYICRDRACMTFPRVTYQRCRLQWDQVHGEPPLELTLLFFFLAIEKREEERASPRAWREPNHALLGYTPSVLPSFHKMRPKRTLSPSESENTASDSPIRIHTDTAALVDDKDRLS